MSNLYHGLEITSCGAQVQKYVSEEQTGPLMRVKKQLSWGSRWLGMVGQPVCGLIYAG